MVILSNNLLMTNKNMKRTINYTPKYYVVIFTIQMHHFDTTTHVDHDTPCTLTTCECIGGAMSTKHYCISSTQEHWTQLLVHKHHCVINTSCLIMIISISCPWLASHRPMLLWPSLISIPEFNRNMVVDANSALIVDSDVLCYNITFGANFLYKHGFHLD